MYQKNKKIKNITVFIIISIMLVFTGYSIKYNRQSTIVESIIKDSVTTLIDVSSTPFKYVADKWNIFLNADKIYKEYESLKQENISFQNKENVILELQKENKELRELLSIENSILDMLLNLVFSHSLNLKRSKRLHCLKIEIFSLVCLKCTKETHLQMEK